LRHRLKFQLAPWTQGTGECGSGSSEDKTWRTPNTMDALEPKSQETLDYEAAEIRPGRSEPNNLRDQLAVREGQRQWPTPTSRDWKDGSAQACSGVPTNSLLGREIHWPTPTERDYKSGRGNAERQYSELTPLIERVAPCGSLNPEFVTWLMKFPKNWTDVD
jgi:hypothetical protein